MSLLSLRGFRKSSEEKTPALVEEIHKEFFTEAERLLEEAKTFVRGEVNEALKDKAERLRKLGFVSAKEVILHDTEKTKVELAEKEHKYKQLIAEAIEYFSMKYPQYKFITMDSIERICSKYGLIMGAIEHYRGSVPDENLLAIEQAKIENGDASKVRKETTLYLENMTLQAMMYRSTNPQRVIIEEEKPFEIAAPAIDFNTENLILDGFKLRKPRSGDYDFMRAKGDLSERRFVPDPVVFKLVNYKGMEFALIITAWGPEASDPDVVNEKMN